MKQYDLLQMLKETMCVTMAMFGLGVIGMGLQKIYDPLAYIYGGILLIFFANLGAKQK